MISISYLTTVVIITGAWIASRLAVALKNKKVDLKREVQLLLVYVCINVVARFTLFRFGNVNNPLVFSVANLLPPRVNLIPFVNLFDYPTVGEALLNVLGNTLMFVPLGIVFPIVYKRLDSYKMAALTGFCCSLCIELVQLFLDRVSDVDDLILNTLGYVIGYLVYRFFASRKKVN